MQNHGDKVTGGFEVTSGRTAREHHKRTAGIPERYEPMPLGSLPWVAEAGVEPARGLPPTGF